MFGGATVELLAGSPNTLLLINAKKLMSKTLRQYLRW